MKLSKADRHAKREAKFAARREVRIKRQNDKGESLRADPVLRKFLSREAARISEEESSV